MAEKQAGFYYGSLMLHSSMHFSRYLHVPSFIIWIKCRYAEVTHKVADAIMSLHQYTMEDFVTNH